jgi:hypothetical protein
MSRKHFIAIAAILKQLRAESIPDGPDCVKAVEAAAYRLAGLFVNDNPRFSMSRFLSACGVDDSRGAT